MKSNLLLLLFVILQLISVTVQALPADESLRHKSDNDELKPKSILKHGGSSPPSSAHVRFNDAIYVREFSTLPKSNDISASNVIDYNNYNNDYMDGDVFDYVETINGDWEEEAQPQTMDSDTNQYDIDKDETGSDVRLMHDYNSVLKEWEYEDEETGTMHVFHHYLEAWDFVRYVKIHVRNHEWKVGIKSMASLPEEKSSYMVPDGGLLLTSEYQHGVRFCDSALKWMAFIPQVNRPEVVIGYYDDSRQAALAYNKVMDEYFGKYGIRLPQNRIR